MPFTSADYQGMAQQRRRRRQPRAQVAQAASRARNESSRQVPAGGAGLDRSRPGVPAMPVQGISAPRIRTAAELAGGVAVGGVPTGTTPTGGGAPTEADGGAPIETDGGVPEGLEQQTGMIPGGMLAQQRLATRAPAFGQMAGGLGVDPADIFAPTEDLPQSSAEDAVQIQAQRLLAGVGGERMAEVSPQEAGRAAAERLRGRAPGYGETLPGDVTELSEEEKLQEEFDELIAGLEAEREETESQVMRGISAQQRRQAEINAMAGRSIGGGFGGAMATTSVMGVAALEEADRAIREKITNAQAAWLDQKMRAVEADKTRAQQEKLLRAEQAHQVRVAATEMGAGLDGDGGGGYGGGSGPTVEGAAGAPGAPGAGTATAPSELSQREFHDQGWRREAGTGRWKNEGGEYWDEVNPGVASPYDGSEHFQDYESTAGRRTGSSEEWAWGGRADTSDADHPPYILGSDPELEAGVDDAQGGEYSHSLYEAYPALEDYRGKTLWDAFWDGAINLNDMIHATRRLNEGEFDKSDWKDEDFHEEAMDNLFSDETIYTGPGGEEVDGEEIYDILLSEPGGLVYLMGWNEGHTSDVFSDWLEGSAVEGYGSSGYGNMDVDNDTDLMLMYVAGQPGMLKEIVNWALYQRQQGSGTEYLAGENSIDDLREHLEQAGFIRPSYDQ